MLPKALIIHPDFVVKFPDDDYTNACQKAVHARHRSLSDLHCVAGGHKLPFKDAMN